MNPLGSFSFGKIIKTFIPGLIASLSLIILIELSYQWRQPFPSGIQTHPLWTVFAKQSFFNRVVLHDTVRAATCGSALLLVALSFGFYLNTLLWMFANKRFRSCADASMNAILKEARTKLCAAPREGAGDTACSLEVPHHVYYLSLMGFDKLSHIHESYFSWYEFQANSAMATAISSLAYVGAGIALFIKLDFVFWTYVLYLGIPLLIGGIASVSMVYAAKRNLTRFQEYLVWFILGCLKYPPK